MDILNITPIDDKVSKDETEVVQKQKHEYKHLGSYLRTRGLKLWSYTPLSGKLKEVTIKQSKTITMVVRDGKLTAVDLEMEKAMVDTRNIYFEALNYKNAKKRLGKFKAGKLDDLCNLRKPGGIDFYDF